MGYRIRYGPEPVFAVTQQKSHLRALTAGAVLVFVLLVRLLWPQGTAVLRRVLLPGEDVSTAAFVQMTESIRAGEDVGEAVTAFCRSIAAEEFGQ